MIHIYAHFDPSLAIHVSALPQSPTRTWATARGTRIDYRGVLAYLPRQHCPINLDFLLISSSITDSLKFQLAWFNKQGIPGIDLGSADTSPLLRCIVSSINGSS
jgi:hypothetical protein